MSGIEKRTAGDNSQKSSAKLISFVILAIAFVAMALLSWRKWPDLLIDFGAQLYTPWRLSEGDVLYRDVAYLPGALSSYYHALLFKLFGVSLNVVMFSNFAVLIAMLWMVYRGFIAASDRLTATFIALSLIIGFAFAEFLDVGNYNYICPYAHEATHGLLLTIGMILLLDRWLNGRPLRAIFLAGLCYGLTFPTKPEIFVGSSGVVFAATFLSFIEQRRALNAKVVLLFILGTLIALTTMFLVFFAKEDFAMSVQHVAGAWMPLLTSRMAEGRFFQSGFGFTDPVSHLKQTLLQGAIFLAIVKYCAWRLRDGKPRNIERLVTYCALAAIGINFDWTHCGHALPVVLLFATVVVFLEWKNASSKEKRKLRFIILWLAFSFALLAKMGVNVRINHYGAFLGMPAFLAAVYFALWQLPQWLQKFGVSRVSFRNAMILFLCAGFFRMTVQSALFYKDKNFPIGPPNDRIITYNPKITSKSEAVSETLEWIGQHVKGAETIACIPEGATINYLSRRRNPTPYVVFMSEVYAFGEDKMLEAYKKNPPDYMIVIHRDSSEYFPKFFGTEKGYGLDTMQWVNQNYAAAHLIGHEPLEGGVFGIKILKRNHPTQ